jgi:hypothetical protein
MPILAEPQRCKFCPARATKALVWGDGRSRVAVCPAHEAAARRRIREQGESIIDVVTLKEGALNPSHPADRMSQALELPPDFCYDDRVPGEGFGRRVDPERRESALEEAPAEAPPKARGSIRRSLLPSGKVREIPDSLLKMLGTDWKRLKANRVHDNRINMDIDGTRFTVYTRRG